MRFWMLIGAIALLLAFLAWQYPYVLGNGDSSVRILHGLMWLALIASGSGTMHHLSSAKGMRDLAMWLGIVMVLMLGYSYRYDIQSSRLFGALVPGRVQIQQGGAMQIRMGEGGHFFLETKINGAPERFMIDTGATDIVLSPRAAQAAGFDTNALAYTRTYQTANGANKGAPVRLDVLEVGPYVLRDVPASVNGAPMDTSLLGMEFLNQFDSYHVEGDTLTLYPRKQ